MITAVAVYGDILQSVVQGQCAELHAARPSLAQDYIAEHGADANAVFRSTYSQALPIAPTF